LGAGLDVNLSALEVRHEDGELSSLHSTSASIESVSDAAEEVGDDVLLGDELVTFLDEGTVAVHLSDRCWAVHSARSLDEGVEASIVPFEEGDEPAGCRFRGGVSIVRAEVDLCNVCGFPRLPPGQ
jgi:hypothetical protein